MSDTIKQIIVIRTNTDPPMRKGKAVAQGSHASMAFLTKKINNRGEIKISKITEDWLNNGSTKICVRVDSEEELFDIFNKAKNAGLEVHLIKDSGRTEFKEPTNTCLAIGPDYSSKIDPITNHLRLL